MPSPLQKEREDRFERLAGRFYEGFIVERFMDEAEKTESQVDVLQGSDATTLLITTDLKVLDVAMESGFSSVAPFYAAFARHSAGLRPLEYRHRHRPATEAAPPSLFP